MRPLIHPDLTSLRLGQSYITVLQDLDAKRLLFVAEGRDHQTVLDFAADLRDHGSDPAEAHYVCMDMSAAYAKGVALALPEAQISCDRYHVVAMAMKAMDRVRRAEMGEDAQAVRSALGRNDRHAAKQLMWGMRRNPLSWSAKQTDVMHWLQRSALKSARAWRLKMALRELYARARAHNNPEQAATDFRA